MLMNKLKFVFVHESNHIFAFALAFYFHHESRAIGQTRFSRRGYDCSSLWHFMCSKQRVQDGSFSITGFDPEKLGH